MSSLFLNILVSVPVIILATLLFIPLGVLLLFLRYAVSNDRKDRRGSVSLIIIGILLLVPRIILLLAENIHFDPTGIPFFVNIVTNDFYMINVTKCAIAIIVLGIVSLIVSLAFKRIVARFRDLISGAVQGTIQKREEKRAEFEKENDLKIKEMEYKAQNSHVVTCPNCGANSTIVGDSGVCGYCRQPIGK